MTLLNLLLTSLAINGIFFIIALLLHTDIFTDITYSLTFIILTVIMFLTAENINFIKIMTAAAVIIWGLRLGSYLFYRILHIKVDHRFDDKRDSFVKFGLFWLLQAVTIWVVLLPVYGIITSELSLNSQYLLIPGVILFTAGLIIETVADIQKYRFKMNPGNKGFISSGLWKYSRHPNYFGEIIFWWGIALPGIFIFSGFQLLYFTGPLFITLLIIFVSGIPLLEKSADSKWGDNPDYISYKQKTSILVPLPPKKS
ncbi:MAG: DUF1295 domain-containing protein [Spirochaetes bacterium]|nr:DUF1295 domain-containing protein [Spirochaetota bacterium]